ncbi:hypothetical protein CJF31_00007310 [Rutstroemia sp. NJR-2017a BVV2]|nr:hypothetical protein CJF31_00007310 [Rutstroemia sp. NJR-2017a BVV2]
MASPDDLRYQKDYSSRRRSRSPTTDSEEEERRRRRRRRERDADREPTRSDRRDDRRDDRSRTTRDKYEDKERHRRRSRSPEAHSRRGDDDRESKYRKRERSRDRRRMREDDDKPSSRDAENALGRRQAGPLPSQASSFQQNQDPSSTALVSAGDQAVQEKQKPNLGQTGILAAASNAVAQADGTSIVLKYHEPPEARKPPTKDDWKLFVFKGADIVDTIELSTRSCWLIGRELSVVDLAAEHPSISKQHAVIQFRYIEKTNEFGDKLGRVRPYLIDLDSANGTLLNKDEIAPSRYVELRDKDMVQFGHSTREYVLMLPPKV